MANETNPASMLALYRQMSDEDMNTEAKRFLALTPDERAELLFYIVMHGTRMMRMIHEMVDPNAEALSQPLPKLDKGH